MYRFDINTFPTRTTKKTAKTTIISLPKAFVVVVGNQVEQNQKAAARSLSLSYALCFGGAFGEKLWYSAPVQ